MITQGSLRQACWRAGTSQPVKETIVGGMLCVDAEAAPGQCGLMFAQSGDAVRRRVTFAEPPHRSRPGSLRVVGAVRPRRQACLAPRRQRRRVSALLVESRAM